MSDAKLHTLDELKKMSLKDRSKLMDTMRREIAETNLNLKTGKEKRSHLKNLWEKQVAQIQTLNRKENLSNQNVSNEN